MDMGLNIYSIIGAEKSLQGGALNMETIRCSKTSVPVYKSVLRHIALKSSRLHSHSHENIKCRLTTKFITRTPCLGVGEELVYIVRSSGREKSKVHVYYLVDLTVTGYWTNTA